MNLVEFYRLSLRSLAANKLRSGLTMLGIVIGVAAVIALLAIGQGASQAITTQVQGIGSNIIGVESGAYQERGVRSAAGSAMTLTLEDAQALRNSSACPDVALVAPFFSASAQVVFGANNLTTNVGGVSPEYETVRNAHAVVGRFIQARDDETLSRVAAIGGHVATSLFGTGDPLGQTIKINRVPFTVVGVMQSKGGLSMLGASQDDTIFVPIRTAEIRLFGSRSLTATGQRRVSVIYASAAGENRIDAATSEIVEELRRRHRIQFQQDDFTAMSQKDLLGALSQITGILTLFLGSIAAISLLVGGIGIMNIMLVSVTERTREVGIRKAVGASRRDILWQFLIEAMALSLSGGLVGILLGAGIATLVNSSGMITTVIQPNAVALAEGFSLAVGLFFGLYPAWRASSLHPIEALRYE